jgi:NADH-quinone oxidoreductase subunit K
MVGPVHYLVLGAILFALGAAGVVIRRNALIVLMSIEIMLNAVNLSFLAFSRFPLVPTPPMQSGIYAGQVAVFFVIAVAAAEAAVGLAIVIAVFRSRTSVHVDEFDTLKL